MLTFKMYTIHLHLPRGTLPMSNAIARSGTKVALVTGASSGIGEAIAEQLADAGYHVFGTSRRGANGTRSGAMKMIALDVTDDASATRAIETVIAHCGNIDLLVNNAGFGVLGGAEESSLEQARQIFETNFFGAIRMMRLALPHMRKAGSGRIVNVSSVLGFLPAPYMALYSASKHAMEGYSESVDHELRHLGIRVSVVEPAYTKTSFDANMAIADGAMAEYEAERAHMQQFVVKALESADSPGVVAQTVLRAATDVQPRARYTAGRLAGQLAFLRRFAPAAFLDRSLRKQMALPVGS